MGILSLLFSFNGRINRAQYWIGGASAGVAILFVLVVMMVLTGPVDRSLDSKQQLAHFFGMFMLALLPAMMVGSWIGYALAWKRFHDRGKSGVWVFLPMLPSFMMISGVVGAAMTGAAPITAMAAAQPWATILWLIQLWFLVELGFMPGKEGPNKYGNPPGNGLSTSVVSGAPSPQAKAGSQTIIPGMGQAPAPQSLVGAESAIDRAIAARAKQAEAQQPQARPAPIVSAPVASLRPAVAGSFGRKVAQ